MLVSSNTVSRVDPVSAMTSYDYFALAPCSFFGTRYRIRRDFMISPFSPFARLPLPVFEANALLDYFKTFTQFFYVAHHHLKPSSMNFRYHRMKYFSRSMNVSTDSSICVTVNR